MSVPTTITDQLIRDEGIRLEPYTDTKGNITIGVGTNLSAGITMSEAMFLFNNRLARTQAQLNAALPWAGGLSHIRYAVLVNMAFNLGVVGLLAFKQFLTLVQAGQYAAAAKDAMSTPWASEVTPRSDRLMLQLEKGEWF